LYQELPSCCPVTKTGAVLGVEFKMDEDFESVNVINAAARGASVGLSLALNIGAMLLGGLGNMAPNRRQDIAHLGLRVVTAGMLASLLSATIAGMLL
jgi:nucleoside permease NupC